MDTSELATSKSRIIVEIIQSIPKAILSKTTIKKITKNITASSFDAGEKRSVKTAAFGKYLQIIEGTTEISSHDKKHSLPLGESIITRAHANQSFKATIPFTIISTITKSGYNS